MADKAASAAGDTLGKAQILGLAAMAVGVFVIANDFTALSVALPAIEKDFGVDLTTAQWVINGYAMVFGVLIVTGGRLADMFGRRRIFFIGSAIFAVFSFIGGFAPDIWVLLAARFLMGVGGAMMWPAILGMTYGLLPESKEGLAGGIILGAAGFGNAVGPLLGGVLTDVVELALDLLPQSADRRLRHPGHLAGGPEGGRPPSGEHKIDYGGIAVLSAGLLALLLALDEGTDVGWLDVRIIGLFVVAVLALTGFVLVERRAGEPRAGARATSSQNREFAAACLATLLMSALFFSALLYLPQFMMKRLDYSAIGPAPGSCR